MHAQIQLELTDKRKRKRGWLMVLHHFIHFLFYLSENVANRMAVRLPTRAYKQTSHASFRGNTVVSDPAGNFLLWLLLLKTLLQLFVGRSSCEAFQPQTRQKRKWIEWRESTAIFSAAAHINAHRKQLLLAGGSRGNGRELPSLSCRSSQDKSCVYSVGKGGYQSLAHIETTGRGYTLK